MTNIVPNRCTSVTSIERHQYIWATIATSIDSTIASEEIKRRSRRNQNIDGTETRHNINEASVIGSETKGHNIYLEN